MTVFLKDISSIEYTFASKPIFILYAVLSIVLGTYIQNNYMYGTLLWGIIIGLIFIVLFCITKKRFVIVTSHSSQRIRQVADDEEKAKSFINKIIKAKAKT